MADSSTHKSAEIGVTFTTTCTKAIGTQMRNIARAKFGKLTMKAIECSRASEDAPRLSAHEMAALLLLRHAPIDVIMGTPDVVALQNAGLADLIESEIGEFTFAITSRGNTVLRAFGMLNDPRDKVRPLFRF